MGEARSSFGARGESGLLFSARIQRRAVSLIPARFVLASFARSRNGAADDRRSQRFGDHDRAQPKRRI
jgi:hypothetical protein